MVVTGRQGSTGRTGGESRAAFMASPSGRGEEEPALNRGAFIEISSVLPTCCRFV